MKELVKISFTGDLMCMAEEHRAVMSKFGRYDFSGYCGVLSPLFASSDYVIGDLETPVSPSNRICEKAILFNASPAFLDALQQTGFRFFTTANNHCLDCGEVGIRETIEQLDARGLEHDGTYCEKSDADCVFVKDIGGVKVAICCFTFGTNSQHNGVFLSDENEWKVALLKKQAKYRSIGFDPDKLGGVRLCG